MDDALETVRDLFSSSTEVSADWKPWIVEATLARVSVWVAIALLQISRYDLPR